MRFINNIKNGLVVFALFFSFANYAIENQVEESDDSYWSDSEDEEDYTWPGYPEPEVHLKAGDRCLMLGRGIHFSPNLFSKECISRIRKNDDVGKPHCSSAAYNLAGVPLGEPQDNPNVVRKGIKCKREMFKLSSDERDSLQQVYSNSYTSFHKKLAEKKEGPFNKLTKLPTERNLLVSGGEKFWHPVKYALGLKYLGEGRNPLDPAYDDQGKPRHPYLGKLFSFVIDIKKLRSLRPYFVVHAHANNKIKIHNHFRNDVLREREVSIPGLIPGEFVAFSIPVRVPSFEGEYQDWYQKKYGISKRLFKARKKILTEGTHHKSQKSPEELKKATVHSLLEDVILPHLASTLEAHVKNACEKQGASVVYKKLDGKFGPTPPYFFNVTQRRQATA